MIPSNLVHSTLLKVGAGIKNSLKKNRAEILHYIQQYSYSQSSQSLKENINK